MRRLALAFLFASFAGCREAPTSHYGVRLGDSMDNARAAFRPSGEGGWTSEAGKVPALVFTAKDAKTHPREARLEFHDGMLVAGRFVTTADDPAAKGPPVEVTPASVIERSSADGSSRVTVVSRSCPEHVAEVARILAAKPR